LDGIVRLSLCFRGRRSWRRTFEKNIRGVGSEGLPEGVRRPLAVPALVIFFCALAVLQIWGPRIVGLDNAYYLPSFYLLFGSWGVTTLYQNIARSFLGLRLPLKQVATDLARNIALVILLILVQIYKGGFIYLAASYMGAACSGLIVALYMSRFLWGGRWSVGLAMNYLSFGSANFFAGAVQAAARNLDVVIVKTYLGTSDLAVYYGSKRLVSFLEPLSSALSMSVFPVISAMSAKNDLNGIRGTIRRLERVTALAVAPVFGVVLWFAPMILLLILGKGYSSQPYVFVGLFAGATVFIVGLGYTFAPGAMGRPSITFRNAGFALIGWLVLSFVLVPARVLGVRTLGMGLPGIVIAHLLYWTIWTVLDRRILSKWVGTRFSLEVPALIVFGVISAGVSRLLVLTGSTVVRIVVSLTLASLVTLCIYGALLLVFRILRISELIVRFREARATFRRATLLDGKDA